MSEVRVCRHSNDFAVDVAEFLNPLRESDDFRWANKRKVQWIEENHQVFAFVVRKLDFLELAVDDGGPFKIWGWLLDLRSHLDMPDQVEKRKRSRNKSRDET